MAVAPPCINKTAKSSGNCNNERSFASAVSQISTNSSLRWLISITESPAPCQLLNSAAACSSTSIGKTDGPAEKFQGRIKHPPNYQTNRYQGYFRCQHRFLVNRAENQRWSRYRCPRLREFLTFENWNRLDQGEADQDHSRDYRRR